MSQFFKVVPTACACGGLKAWVVVHPNGDEQIVGCICHNSLPYDAKIIGEYIDRPHKDDPMPLNDGVERTQWRRRNLLRDYGRESYAPPVQPLEIPDAPRRR